jgi:hypothetical protein
MTQLELLLRQLESENPDKKDEARLLLGTFYPHQYREHLASKLRKKGMELVGRLRQRGPLNAA